jgi:hypothetical protein
MNLARHWQAAVAMIAWSPYLLKASAQFADPADPRWSGARMSVATLAGNFWMRLAVAAHFHHG